MYFVDERLNLALYTFELGTLPFEEVSRKIEASELPYDHPTGRDDSEDDAYQEAFENTNVAIQVIGMSCVELVQTALQVFLKEFVERSFGRQLLGRVSQIKHGWFLHFKALFAAIPGYDWANSGADLYVIEQLCLTRNDFHHSVNLVTRYPYQSKKHADKYPDSLFLDPAFCGAFMHGPPLLVTRETLQSSINEVRKLCEYIVNARRIPRPR
jgi:hypothetical protein